MASELHLSLSAVVCLMNGRVALKAWPKRTLNLFAWVVARPLKLRRLCAPDFFGAARFPRCSIAPAAQTTNP